MSSSRPTEAATHGGRLTAKIAGLSDAGPPLVGVLLIPPGIRTQTAIETGLIGPRISRLGERLLAAASSGLNARAFINGLEVGHCAERNSDSSLMP
jgi:hypothetical protein